MRREIKGIDALSKALPDNWLLYVALNCYPRNQDPMEIDAVVVMDDQVLLLEIKDWNGELKATGDKWVLGRAPRGRSAVYAVEDKAKKLRSVIQSESAWAGSYWIESRVVLTGTANKSGLPHYQADRTWSLQEACSLKDPARRQVLLPRRQIKLKKAYEFETEFDRIFNNARLFQPLEADWAGFRVTERDLFVHPNGVWTDHFAERQDEQRIKALVRLWSFDRLPVGLNSAETRKLVALRETNVFGYLTDVGSELVKRHKVLRDVNAPADPIPTDHFEVRSVDPGWSTLDRYLVRRRDDLNPQDRIVIATALLSLVSELHGADVTHRDIGMKAVWVGGPSDLALTGFMSCQLPDKGSVFDWLSELRGYASFLPEDRSGAKSTGRHRDVYSCAYLTALILTDLHVSEHGVQVVIDSLPAELASLASWLRRGLAEDPGQRYPDVTEQKEAFAAAIEARQPDGFDATLLDRFETPDVPYQRWPIMSGATTKGLKQVYETVHDERPTMVKVWMSLVRNRSLALDCALLRLLEGADRLREARLVGFPRFVACGLSPIGAFVAYEKVPGQPVAELTELPNEASLKPALDLLLAVAALHSLGCDHGDISPTNVLVELKNGPEICLVDPFDMSPVGDGSVRTPAMCPTNWERLSAEALDRFAAVKVAMMLLSLDPSEKARLVFEQLHAELERPVIESLELATAALRGALARAKEPTVERFVLSTHADTSGFKGGQPLYVRRKLFDSGARTYFITTPHGQLLLNGDDTSIKNYRFRPASFTSLANESRSGYADLPLDVTAVMGPESGFEELYAYLNTHERFVTSADVRTGHTAGSFHVARHWQKLVELEADARVEIAIRGFLSQVGESLVCSYENLGKDFDFDDEDLIEVHAGTRRIGSVDLAASALPSAIALRCDRSALTVGDRVRLVGRREQTSIDRRSRAVRRILEQRSAIDGLLEYLSPDSTSPSVSYELEASDDDLRRYDLNDGQRAAFRKLLRVGPVGLLQGPPGTGKTRFIASFVHWLLTQGGAQRVLIASQSHEAVNNAVDALLLLHRRTGDKVSLLRIGSKGITERIKPYHSAELRERYRIRFEAAAKYRFGQITTALGVSKDYSGALFDLDQQVGTLARRCSSVEEAFATQGEQLALDRERNRVQLRRVQDAFRAAYMSYTGNETTPENATEKYEQLVSELAAKYDVSPADAVAAQRALKLTQDWLSSLGSPGRNFEEFLAKTRNVVAATCVGVGETRIRIDAQVFDWVIVDEAARCTPGELAVPIQMARRILLVGDHLQLRPMLDRSLLKELQESEPDVPARLLSISDFERAFNSAYGESAGAVFQEQYRMDDAICSLVSDCFYEPHKTRLLTSPDRKPSLHASEMTAPILRTPLVWIDTKDRANRNEQQPPGSTSFFNPAESEAVISVLSVLASDAALVDALEKQDDETPIGVICTYSAQKRHIEDAWSRHGCDARFRRMVRIDTVDAYQGKENAIVVLSLVRSNDLGLAGHVDIANRCNVAVSRAKERLIIVGNTEMWGAKASAASPMRSVLNFLRSSPQSTAFWAAEDIA